MVGIGIHRAPFVPRPTAGTATGCPAPTARPPRGDSGSRGGAEGRDAGAARGNRRELGTIPSGFLTFC